MTDYGDRPRTANCRRWLRALRSPRSCRTRPSRVSRARFRRPPEAIREHVHVHGFGHVRRFVRVRVHLHLRRILVCTCMCMRVCAHLCGCGCGSGSSSGCGCSLLANPPVQPRRHRHGGILVGLSWGIPREHGQAPGVTWSRATPQLTGYNVRGNQLDVARSGHAGNVERHMVGIPRARRLGGCSPSLEADNVLSWLWRGARRRVLHETLRSRLVLAPALALGAAAATSRPSVFKLEASACGAHARSSQGHSNARSRRLLGFLAHWGGVSARR